MRSRYQLGKHWNGTRLSVAMVASFLDPEARTGLDIGSNEGALTCVLAKSGVDVLGVEMNRRARENAEILARGMNVSPRFEGRIFSLEDIEKMEEVDVVLFLSVHHQLVVHNDLDYANAFLKALGRKTRMQLFFQPACLLRKYKKPMPFADNDVQAIIAYFLELMEDVFPYRGLAGFSLNDTPRQEPLRPMLLFSHKPIQPYPGRDVVGLIDELRMAGRPTHPLMRKLKSIAPNG